MAAALTDQRRRHLFTVTAVQVCLAATLVGGTQALVQSHDPVTTRADVATRGVHTTAAVTTSASKASTSTATSPVASTVAAIREINWYPRDGGWGSVWTNWRPAELDADMGLLASLHANTVRLFLQPSAFGYPIPGATAERELLSALQMAAGHGLKVHLNLFDGFSSYSDINGSEQWASAILGLVRNDPRVSVVELENEVDPSNTTQMTWAQTLLPYVRSRGAGVAAPVTVSVSGWGSAAVLSSLVAALGDSQPDFYSFHFYASDPALAFAAFQQAKQAAAPLPLFIGETGYSTYAQNTSAPGVPGTRGAHESYQDLFLRTVEQAALQAGLPPAAPWGLYDFMAAAQPNLVERYFGLYRADGTPKPAAASVASILAGNPVNLSYDAGMETYAGGFPGGWRLLDPFSATFALDTTVAYSGASSARISGSGTPDAWGPAYVTSPPSTVVPGGRYYLQVYARGAAATGTSRATVYWFDGTGGNLGSALMTRSLPNGTTGWTSLAGYGQAPAGSVYVRIALSSQGNSGTTWFDQVTFVPVA